MVWSVVAPSVDPPDELDDFGKGVVPETTEGAVAPVAMSASSDPDIHAAACAHHAAVGTARERSGDSVFLVDHQTLRLAAGLVVVGVVLAGLRLIAQAELQAAAAALQPGV